MRQEESAPEDRLLVALLVALDTKGAIGRFLEGEIRCQGAEPLLCDIGMRNAGGLPFDRRQVTARVAQRVQRHLRGHLEAGHLAGMMGVGGSYATGVTLRVAGKLPSAIPKVLVSTTVTDASTVVRAVPDVIPVWSVTDLDTPNRLNIPVLRAAACAIAGLARNSPAEAAPAKPLVGTSMLGVTTPCVEAASEVLRGSGLDVASFHAIGSGGELLEGFIREGRISGVLDVSLAEVTSEVFGLTRAGVDPRLTAAAQTGIPQVVVPGAVSSLVVPANSAPPQGLSSNESIEIPPLGRILRVRGEGLLPVADLIASRLNRCREGTCLVFLPEKGLSASDRAGLPGDLGEGRLRFYGRLLAGLDLQRVRAMRVPLHICDREFGHRVATELLGLLGAATEPRP